MSSLLKVMTTYTYYGVRAESLAIIEFGYTVAPKYLGDVFENATTQPDAKYSHGKEKETLY